MTIHAASHTDWCVKAARITSHKGQQAMEADGQEKSNTFSCLAFFVSHCTILFFPERVANCKDHVVSINNTIYSYSSLLNRKFIKV